MSKIIKFHEVKNKKNNAVQHTGSLMRESTDRIKDKLEMFPYIVTELHEIIERAISEAGLDPGEFSMSPTAEANALSFNVGEFFEGDEEAFGMVFEATIDGTRYGAVGSASASGEEIYYDCDADTLLIKVESDGPACHTGSRSCFFNRLV